MIDQLEHARMSQADKTTYAKLFDHCKTKGYEVAIYVDGNSKLGPSHAKGADRTRGLILAVRNGTTHQIRIPAAKTIELAAKTMLGKLKVS